MPPDPGWWLLTGHCPVPHGHALTARVGPMGRDGGGSGIAGVSADGETSPIPQLPSCTEWMWRSGTHHGTSPTWAEPVAPLCCSGRVMARPGDEHLPRPNSLPGSLPAPAWQSFPRQIWSWGRMETCGSHPTERMETPVTSWCRSRWCVIDGAACDSAGICCTCYGDSYCLCFETPASPVTAHPALRLPMPPVPPHGCLGPAGWCWYHHPSFMLMGPMGRRDVLHLCWEMLHR